MNWFSKIKEFLGLSKKYNKDKSMAEYQGNKEGLDYKKVGDAFNKIKNSKNKNFDSLKSNLNNFSKEFQQLSNDEKQVELKSEKFQKLLEDINSLNNNDIKKIMNSMASQRELSDCEKLAKDIENIQETLIRLEKEDIKEQGKNLADIAISTDKIDDIAKIIDNIKDSTPKIDFNPITQKIDSLKKELQNNKNNADNSNKELFKKIDNIKFPTPPTPQKIPTDYLKKDDFEFTLKDLKESSENLEILPAKVISIEKKIIELSEKLDNLPSSNGSQTLTHIPNEEKSVIELAKYMRDGVAQFENIAKEYVSKIGELEKLDKSKEEHQEELKKVRKEEFEKGKETGKIELIKNLAEKFPTEFKVIQSTFEDLLEERFEKDKVLEIDDNNINEMLPFIEEKIENGKYKVLSTVLLVDNKILFKASVKKVT